MKPRNGQARRGVTLIEVLIATIVLAVAAVSVMNIFRGANIGIRKTDEKRELRYYVSEIFNHINRQALHDLWDHFGPKPWASRSLGGGLALIDANGQLVNPSNLNNNPLGITQAFINEMRNDGLGAKVFFEFYYKEDLRIEEDDEVSEIVGLQHMQAGIAAVALYDLNDPEERNLIEWRQPVMCPMIVGRPGIQLSSCPALNTAVKCQYGPLLAQREPNGRFDASDC